MISLVLLSWSSIIYDFCLILLHTGQIKTISIVMIKKMIWDSKT